MKISFSLRAFVVYFIILATLSWFILDKAIERLNVALRQSAESVLVDTANLLATSLEAEFKDQVLDTGEIRQLFNRAYNRNIQAQIYNVTKNKVDTEVYVTDRDGTVVYDSSGLHTGEDFSEWRDVRLTLDGEYGARTSFKFEDQTEEDDEKIMVIAAPIRIEHDIVGVVSVVKPIQSLEAFLLDESNQLKQYAIGLLAIAMILGYLVSHGFTASIGKLVNYANGMAAGRKTAKPRFMDKRFDHLSNAINNLRQQIDGKNYVEDYIHSLTHELKTPLTVVEASTELLSDDMPVEQRRKFIGNIRTANARMSRLVDRMLELAQLESMDEVALSDRFDLAEAVGELIDERDALIREKALRIARPESESIEVHGDALLLQQAIANLLDNAIEHCPINGEISVIHSNHNQGNRITVFNQGGALDEFIVNQAFDRFFSVPPEEATKGTGLGLAFVREIMSLHQGTAELENTENGVVATIWWPDNISST
ncbi:MAG: two-component system sensor histidine kinase CreC [Pseudomonadota bacterium]